MKAKHNRKVLEKSNKQLRMCKTVTLKPVKYNNPRYVSTSIFENESLEIAGLHFTSISHEMHVFDFTGLCEQKTSRCDTDVREASMGNTGSRGATARAGEWKGPFSDEVYSR